MGFEGIILSEIKYCMISLLCVVLNKQTKILELIDRENRLWLPEVRGPKQVNGLKRFIFIVVKWI